MLLHAPSPEPRAQRRERQRQFRWEARTERQQNRLALRLRRDVFEKICRRMDHDDPLRDIIQLTGTVTTAICQTTGDIRESADEAMSRSEEVRPQSQGLNRASNISRRGTWILAFMAMGFGAALNAVRPVEQPEAVVSRTSPPSFDPDHLPSPKEDQASIMIQLPSTYSVERFLGKHTRRESVSFPAGFVGTFRRSPEEFLKKGSGPCNNYTEFLGECAAAHGMQAYVLGLRPSLWNMRKDEWHQLTLFCVENEKHYIIFDYGSRMEHRGTLEEFVEKHYPVMTVFKCVPWYRAQPNFLAGMTQYSHEHVGGFFLRSHPELAKEAPLTTPSFPLQKEEKLKNGEQLLAGWLPHP